jgi:hypothetical protein
MKLKLKKTDHIPSVASIERENVKIESQSHYLAHHYQIESIYFQQRLGQKNFESVLALSLLRRLRRASL